MKILFSHSVTVAMVVMVVFMYALSLPLASTAQENIAPTVVSVVTSASPGGTDDDFTGGPIALIPASNKALYLNGVVEDLNGRDNIATVRGVFYRSGVSGGSTCSADTASCYVVANCTLSNNGDSNQKVYSCSMSLSYIADSTASGGRYPSENWIAYVYVTDNQAFDEDSSVTKEMGSLLSLNIPNSLAFGSLNLNSQTNAAGNSEMVVSQAGNREADVEVSMADPMTCTSGSIPVNAIKWALTDVGYTHSDNTNLSSNSTDTNLFVGYGTAGTPSPSKTLYWNIGISDGLGGTCSGTTTITVIAH